MIMLSEYRETFDLSRRTSRQNDRQPVVKVFRAQLASKKLKLTVIIKFIHDDIVRELHCKFMVISCCRYVPGEGKTIKKIITMNMKTLSTVFFCFFTTAQKKLGRDLKSFFHVALL